MKIKEAVMWASKIAYPNKHCLFLGAERNKTTTNADSCNIRSGRVMQVASMNGSLEVTARVAEQSGIFGPLGRPQHKGLLHSTVFNVALVLLEGRLLPVQRFMKNLTCNFPPTGRLRSTTYEGFCVATRYGAIIALMLLKV